MNALQRHEFASNALLVPALARHCAELLSAAIAQRGYANLAVSGGSTPRALFDELALQAIAWDRVQITLVDDRWVAADHPDSNERLVREHLLQHAAAAARFIPLTNDGPDVFEATADIEARLKGHEPPLFPLDLVLLGMGEDGHTASWHPGAQTLAQVMDADSHQLCGAVRPVLAAHDRITLTLGAVLQARQLIIHMVGASKRAVLAKAEGPGPVDALPIRGILRQSQVPVELFYAPVSD